MHVTLGPATMKPVSRGIFIVHQVSDVAHSAQQNKDAAVPREQQENGISTMSEAIAFGKMLLERAEAVGMQRTRVSKTRAVPTCLGNSNAASFG